MKEKIAVIEYLRGAAAISVAWFHLTNTYPDGFARLSGSYGWLGVEAFFVISGFVVPYGLSQLQPLYRLQHLSHFIVRRLARLEPAYLASIALVLSLNWLSARASMFNGEPMTWNGYQVLSHLFYLVPITPYPWIQPVYWSLAYEFAFYLGVGLLYPLLHRYRFGVFVAGVAVLLMAHRGLVSPICLLFLMGVALSSWIKAPNPCSSITCYVLVSASAAMLIAVGEYPMAFVGVGVVVLIGLLPNWRLPASMHAAMTWLGSISYSLYLIHVPIGGKIVNLGKRFVNGPLVDAWLSLFALLLCLLSAWLFHRIIERPSMEWSRRLILPKPAINDAIR